MFAGVSKVKLLRPAFVAFAAVLAGFALLRIAGARVSRRVRPRLRVLRRDHRAVDADPIAPRRRRTGQGDGAVDHGLRGHGSGRRARRAAGSATSVSITDRRPRRRGVGTRARGVVESAIVASQGGTRCLKVTTLPTGSSASGCAPRSRRVDAAAFDAVAPATPKWTAHDVLAHLVGVPEDVVNGRMDGLASDAWTQAQVDRHAGASVGAMFADWDACSTGVRGTARGRAGRDHRPGALRRGHARARSPERARPRR